MTNRVKKMISLTLDEEILTCIDKLSEVKGGITKGRNAKGGRGNLITNIIKDYISKEVDSNDIDPRMQDIASIIKREKSKNK